MIYNTAPYLKRGTFTWGSQKATLDYKSFFFLKAWVNCRSIQKQRVEIFYFRASLFVLLLLTLDKEVCYWQIWFHQFSVQHCCIINVFETSIRTVLLFFRNVSLEDFFTHDTETYSNEYLCEKLTNILKHLSM